MKPRHIFVVIVVFRAFRHHHRHAVCLRSQHVVKHFIYWQVRYEHVLTSARIGKENHDPMRCSSDCVPCAAINRCIMKVNCAHLGSQGVIDHNAGHDAVVYRVAVASHVGVARRRRKWRRHHDIGLDHELDLSEGWAISVQRALSR